MKFHRYSMLFVLSVASVGCGQSNTPANRGAHFQVEGKLGENVDKLRGGYNSDACEKDLESIRMELATELDRREEQIGKSSKVTLNEGESLIEFQGTQLIETPLKAVVKKGWTSRQKSWRAIYDYYKTHLAQADDNF